MGKIIKRSAFKEFGKIIKNLIKRTFKLPYKGTPLPMWELFFKFKPENLVIKSFLQNQAKWSDVFIV